MQTPAVSIVCATYNRSDVLANAIRSVIGQTRTDWELIVVGDACTDDTADVVASFDDQRIRFVNRSENAGEQSQPNNDGMALARGALRAYINHDDLWMPEHLEVATALLERRSDVDLAVAGRIDVDEDGSILVQDRRMFLNDKAIDSPPASTWVFRAELVDRIGPWNSAFALRLFPSTDWLLRALDGGAVVAETGTQTVVMMASGQRTGAYLATPVTDLAIAERVLREGRAGLAGLPSARPDPVLRRAIGVVWWPTALALARLGVHPFVVRVGIIDLLTRTGRGARIRSLRARRGLDPASVPHSRP